MAGFTIPNTPDAGNQNQAEPDSLDFQVLGNAKNGVVAGMAVTPGSGQGVAVAGGEVLIDGSYYTYAGGSVALTAYGSSPFFDVIVARLDGSTVTCLAVSGAASAGTNPRYPSTDAVGSSTVVSFATDVVLASVWRQDSDTPAVEDITDKRVFVRSSTARVGASATGGNHSDLWVQPTTWTPSATLEGPLSVNVNGTWHKLARYSANFTAGTVTATSFVGPLTGNVTGNVTGNLSGTATKASTLSQGGGAGTAMTFNWSGQTGQPTWLWGSNDGVNHYVYNPSNFSVANSAKLGNLSGTTAATANTIAARDGDGAVSATIFIAQDGYASQFKGLGEYTYLGQYSMRVKNISNVYTQQIGSGRTVLVNSDATLGTSSSTRRVKENIVPYEDLSKKLLTVSPVTFDYLSSVIDADSQDTRFNQFGMIAEDVHDAGLTHLVHYDKNNKPEGINYLMLSVELLGIVKQQDEQIVELTNRVQALENGTV